MLTFAVSDQASSLYRTLDTTSKGYAKLPFSVSDWEIYGKMSQLLLDSYEVRTEVAKDLDAKNWANEGYEMAANFVYTVPLQSD